MDIEKAEAWMKEALLEAHKSEAEGEVPVGAVVLLNEKIIGRGHNSSIRLHDPSAHAEILALRQAARNISNYRIPGSVMIVTIEPCVMCIGAVIIARLPRVVFGAREPRTGACESVFAIPNEPRLMHRVAVIGGVEEARCRELMQRFFAERRPAM